MSHLHMNLECLESWLAFRKPATHAESPRQQHSASTPLAARASAHGSQQAGLGPEV